MTLLAAVICAAMVTAPEPVLISLLRLAHSRALSEVHLT